MRHRSTSPLKILFLSMLTAVLATGLPVPAVTRAASILPIAIGEILSEGASSVNHFDILYDAGLDPASVPATTDFSVTINGSIQTPTSVSIVYVTHAFQPTIELPAGTQLSVVRIGLSAAMLSGQTGSLTYVPGTHPLKVAGVAIDGFVDQPIGLADAAFVFGLALTDEAQGADHVIAIFSQPLTTGPLPDRGDFSLTVTPAGGSPVVVTPATVSVATAMLGHGAGFLDLRLPSPLAFGSTVTLTYTPGLVRLADLAGTPIADGFTDQTVLMGLAPTSTRTTDPGSNVVVAPADPTTGTQPVTLTFATVGTTGTTSVTSTTTAPTIPAGFQLSGTFYDVQTTATHSGSITLCFTYPSNDPTPTDLLHYEGGAWVVVPSVVDTLNHQICGTTTSLSPFALVVQTLTEPSQIVPEVKAMGLPVKVERGLLLPLSLAQSLYDRHLDRLGNAAMTTFSTAVRLLSPSKITPAVAAKLVADAMLVKKAHGG